MFFKYPFKFGKMLFYVKGVQVDWLDFGENQFPTSAMLTIEAEAVTFNEFSDFGSILAHLD